MTTASPGATAPAAMIAAWLFAELADLGVAVTVSGGAVELRTAGPAAPATASRIADLLAEARFAGWQLAES